METKVEILSDDLMFPVTKPYDTGFLSVGDGHKIYYQQIGNPNGPAVLLVHGGPGAGIVFGARATRLHDPHYFRLIAVDQRGCGQSTPNFYDHQKAAFRNNTTEKLAQDFEKIRTHLNIESWHVYGYSWGSCLGLYYTAHYPKAVKSITIGGIWMHTLGEIDWYLNRMGLFYPEAEEKLLVRLPKSVHRFDRLGYLYHAVTGTDRKKALEIAEAQGAFENAAMDFSPPVPVKRENKKTTAERRNEHRKTITTGALEIFYMKKNPLPMGWYKTAKTVQAIKTIKDFAIIQGRYDIVCPPTTAFDLHRTYPHSKMTMVHYAGHKSSEIPMLQTILKANDRLRKNKK